MAAMPSVKITKSLTWRGSPRLWTNRYHFTAGSPASTAAWLAFFDAIVAAEKAVLLNVVTITRADGYDAGSNLPVATKTYTQLGTKSVTGQQMERQVAALVRYTTDVRTRRNHPVYLFNYYHAAEGTTGAVDTLQTAAATAYNTYAASWVAGFSDGTTTHKRAGPNGAVAQSGAAETYLTHRDFPR